jgi:hypothetical protein
MTRTASRTMARAARCGLVVLAINSVGCRYFGEQQDRGVTTPGFAFETATPAQISNYIGKLHFDERESSSDTRPLVIGCPSACREGPEVAIHPEKRTHKNGEAALAGNGLIIAKLVNKDQKQDYPEYNLAAGDSVYWAVDSVKRVSPERLEGRSLFISAQGLAGKGDSLIVHRELYVDDHPGQEPDGQGLARWVPRKETSEGASIARAWGLDTAQTPTQATEPSRYGIIRVLMAWNNCKSGGCCRS